MESIGVRRLNRDVIKYIAIFTMLLNHIAHVFLKPDTMIYDLFINIGYFTAITMCYFLVEGYKYTHSKKKYALRLLIFAIISEIPYIMAFHYIMFNMLFTLLFCFLYLCAKDYVKNPIIRIIINILIAILCLFSDWSIFALLFVIAFSKCEGKPTRVRNAYIISIGLFWLYNFVTTVNDVGLAQSIVISIESVLGMVISAIIILFFYNGKRSNHFNNFSKWFFYLFYPLHLICLVTIKNL